MSIDQISKIKNRYGNFINNCKIEDCHYSLTANNEVSPYATCFALFGLNLINDYNEIKKNKKKWDFVLRDNLDKAFFHTQNKKTEIIFDKPYLQLLTFTLSSLSIIGTLNNDPLEKYTSFITKYNMSELLSKSKALDGKGGSGNFAMFYFILFYHLNYFLNYNVDDELIYWRNSHLEAMNKFGFWGNSKSMSHLQFQNGYHQYEIFKFMKLCDDRFTTAAVNTMKMSDLDGHYAPYIGGGGCYDYDATFMISSFLNCKDEITHNKLSKTLKTLISEQNNDGGFCESKLIRPINMKYFQKFILHILDSKGVARNERVRQFLTLLRPKYDKIQTHWSTNGRHWNQSNLWDSWFRMLTIAKIDLVFNRENKNKWQFIDYPGIGFHN